MVTGQMEITFTPKPELLTGQCKRVYEYMVEHGSINQPEAHTISVSRLASRIDDLHHYGFQTSWKWDKGINQYGEPYKVKRYWLVRS